MSLKLQQDLTPFASQDGSCSNNRLATNDAKALRDAWLQALLEDGISDDLVQ